MKRKLLSILTACAVAFGGIYLLNAPWRAASPRAAEIKLIAHRGVHQTFHRGNLDNATCTATRIDPPAHDYLENTIRSMRAAFDAGADIVELDVHPTTDARFAVFHDWTLDCRTEGSGETRSHALADLKGLDIGHGYTADGGRTFPFRGKGVGEMPELGEVFTALPGRAVLVNFKSNEAREGDMLAAVAREHPEWRGALWGAYGGDAPTLRAASLIDGLNIWTARGLKQCVTRYLALGWTGYVPEACRNTTIMIPLNVAPWLWGWPDLLLERFRTAGSEVILLGPYAAGDPGTSGIDTLAQFATVPPQFSGYLWTNKIEVIGPALRKQRGD